MVFDVGVVGRELGEILFLCGVGLFLFSCGLCLHGGDEAGDGMVVLVGGEGGGTAFEGVGKRALEEFGVEFGGERSGLEVFGGGFTKHPCEGVGHVVKFRCGFAVECAAYSLLEAVDVEVGYRVVEQALGGILSESPCKGVGLGVEVRGAGAGQQGSAGSKQDAERSVSHGCVGVVFLILMGFQGTICLGLER